MKKAFILIIVLFGLTCTPFTWATERFLKGSVSLVGDHDEPIPLVGQDVRIQQSGDSARTKEGGLFRLFLPNHFQAGSKITLGVEKAGWRIQYPLEGEVIIPNELEKALIDIRMLPVGSKKFWSHDRMEKFIQDVAEKAKQQVQPQGKPQDIDLSRYIKEWALRYGFSVQQAKAEIDKWATEVEQQNDPYQLGLAAFARKNFGEASQLFAQSAQQKAQAYQQALVEAEQYRADIVRDYRLAGDAAYSNYQFAASRSHYENALRHIAKVQQPQLWGAVQNEIGIVIRELAVRTEGNDIHTLFKQAVQAYREALTVYTREALPQDWAATQNNLGIVLREQGIRTQGEAGTQLLSQAVQAYREALTVYTREALPQGWAATQNNLGNVLREQGIRTPGETGTQLLKQAVQAYREALTVYTREALPQDWAATQNNLGIVLSDQGIRTQGEAGTQLLSQAVQAYRDVLEIDSDNEQSYQAAAILYHEFLFAFHDALTVHQQWLQRHSDDLSARASFAEAHFTTGRFAEAEQQLAALMTHNDLEPGTRVGLQGIRIANWLALHEIYQARIIGEELLALLDKLPADFEPGWHFSGAKYYVNQEPQLAAQREVLLDLLTALEEKDAVQRRRVLESVMERIKAMQSNLH